MNELQLKAGETCNGMQCSPVDSECCSVFESLGSDKSMPQSRAAEVERSPWRREGQSKDVANATVYLTSDASSFITGEVIEVNGGMRWIGVLAKCRPSASPFAGAAEQ